MTPDHSICTVPDANGRSVKLEVDPDLFPLSLNLLSTVERSYRDEGRSQPFVSPNRPHGVIGQDQIQTEAVPPGVTIHSAAVELPVDVDTEMARAYVLRWSKLANRWDQIYPSECHIRVHDCQVDIRESGTSGDDLMPLLSLRINSRTTAERRKTTPEITLSGVTRLLSALKIDGDVMFRCRSDVACTLLLRILRREVDHAKRISDMVDSKDLGQPLAEAEQEAEGIPSSSREDQSTADDYPHWNQRLKDVRDELESVKRASGGLSDLQYKMERLSTATANLQPGRVQQDEAISNLYDTSRSPLATRVLVCLTADLKSRPGSYIGLDTDSIVSALGKTPAEISAALKELVAEDQIHHTINENTWVVSHPPNELPVLLAEQPEASVPKGPLQDLSSEPVLSPLADQVHLVLRKYAQEHPEDAAQNTGEVAKAIDQPVEEVGEALTELKFFGKVDIADVAGNDERRWASTAAGGEKQGDGRTESLPPPGNPHIRNAPEFQDTPPSPTFPSDPSSVTAAQATETKSGSAFDMSTSNLDGYISYPFSSSGPWTRIEKRLVDPRILTDAGEEFDDSGEALVLHRAIRRGEVKRWAEQSMALRGWAEETRERRAERPGREIGKGKERDGEQERLDRLLAGDMREEEMRRFADSDDERFI
jgi:hypothetical protein